MAYEVVLEPKEEIAVQIELNLSKKAHPFFFTVSNQAIYIPRTKLFAKTDPYYFKRVPIDQIRYVAIKRLSPYALWLFAVVMILVGFVTTFSMMEPVLKDDPGIHHISGWPIAVFVGGCLLPFAAKGRFGLETWFTGGKYRWKPPLVVDKVSKQKITETLQKIAEACKSVGASVSDNRLQ